MRRYGLRKRCRSHFGDPRKMADVAGQMDNPAIIDKYRRTMYIIHEYGVSGQTLPCDRIAVRLCINGGWILSGYALGKARIFAR